MKMNAEVREIIRLMLEAHDRSATIGYTHIQHKEVTTWTILELRGWSDYLKQCREEMSSAMGGLNESLDRSSAEMCIVFERLCEAIQTLEAQIQYYDENV
jgi:adenylosuccinate lyase